MPVRALRTRDGLRFGRVLAGLLWVTGLVACGDDDNPKPGDASTDSAVDSGGGNFIPRRDASVVAPVDPIMECDLQGASTCREGLVCDVIVRLFEGDTQLTIYTGCVAPQRERGLGDPCDSDVTAGTPYQTEGLRDLVFRDQCGPGLVCAPDPKVRGATSCQPTCSTGRFGTDAFLCEDKKSFCVGSGPFQEFCRPSEGCSVSDQTGCPQGLNCYLRPTDDGEGFLGVCFPPAEKPLADGAACDAYNACRVGSSCNGPLSKAPVDWMQPDYKCRASCSKSGTVTPVDEGDGGMDDGGTAPAPAGCGSGSKCVAFAASGLDVSTITSPPYGQCE